MIKELTEYYKPDKVLHRDEQIQEIENVFRNFRKFGMASNILIQGVTGSGKTTVVDKVIRDMQTSRDDVVFISGSDTRTSFKTIRALFDLNFSTFERILTEGIKKFKEHPKIIIIDEVNKIKDCDSLFDDLNTIYRGTQCPIIIITNKRTIIDSMPEDARLTLLFDKVNFPSYNAIEIKDILVDRLSRIAGCPDVPEEAIAKISAYASRQGSARIALQITMKCILSNNYSTDYIDTIAKNLEREDWLNFVNGLMVSEKRFLDSLLYISDRKTLMRHADFTNYLKDLSPSRISQLTTTFEDYGIILTEYKNLGRGHGRYRVIRFVSDELKENIEKVLYPEKDHGDKKIK